MSLIFIDEGDELWQNSFAVSGSVVATSTRAMTSGETPWQYLGQSQDASFLQLTAKAMSCWKPFCSIWVSLRMLPSYIDNGDEQRENSFAVSGSDSTFFMLATTRAMQDGEGSCMHGIVGIMAIRARTGLGWLQAHACLSACLPATRTKKRASHAQAKTKHKRNT